MKVISVYDIEGFKIGHIEDLAAATGCSVIICEKGASAGVDVRGGSPGTRETDLLDPVNLVQNIHSVVLAGGSAFGLDASSGVMKYLEEKGIGFDTGVAKVPIVSSAVLFDLGIGSSKIRPDKEMGYRACLKSEDNSKYKDGNIGAGAGATIGKIAGPAFSMKGGLGTFALQVGDLKIGALVAVNCLGDVYENGKIIGGALSADKKSFINTEKIMIDKYNKSNNLFSGNTTIGVVITNAKLNKSEAKKIASMAHNGYGRAIRPAHTMFDGDTIFIMSTCSVECDLSTLGSLASIVIEKSIISGVKNADPLEGCPCYSELNI
jgi:L-aminopeptidase/D-esterase-like protein